jgi:hypothetical protein
LILPNAPIKTAVLLAMLLLGMATAASAADVASVLSAHGYYPQLLSSVGTRACQESASQTMIDGLVQATANIASAQKRDLLVEDAVGFARSFANKVQLVSATNTGPTCATGADCTGTAKLLRQLSDIGPNQDWCAAFVATMAELVDEQDPDGPKNLLHLPGTGDASDFASAEKLLAVFDPTSGVRIRWTGQAPAPHPEAFLAAGQRPVPGCVAVYKDAKSSSGHVALVVSVSGTGDSGQLTTVEGNSAPQPGSSERGVFVQFTDRPWGSGANYASIENDGNHEMVYRGCIMPWPGDSVMLGTSNVCAVAQNVSTANKPDAASLMIPDPLSAILAQ